MVLKLVEIRGVGANTAEILVGHGLRSVADVAKADVKKVTSIPGFGELRANDVIAAAAALLATNSEHTNVATERSKTSPNNKKLKTKKKDSKKSKNKKKKGNKKDKKKSKKKNKKKKNNKRKK